MSRSRSGHLDEFAVRCSCGETYNSSDRHTGKKLRCQCGRVLTIVRPDEPVDSIYPPAAKQPSRARGTPRGGSEATDGLSSRRRSRSHSKTSNGIGAARKTISRGWSRLLQSVATWVESERRALGSNRRSQRWCARIAWSWLLVCVMFWLLLITTSESFLPATLLAYGPRFVMLLPFATLVPFALLSSRRSLVPLGLALVVVLGPIMGGRISWRSIGREVQLSTAKSTMRVMSFNAEGGDKAAVRLRAVLAAVRPDVIALQECGDVLWDSLRAIAVLPHTHREGTLCTASRWPIITDEVMPRGAFKRFSEYGYGGTGMAIRLAVQSPYGRFNLVNVHLETARKGLEALIGAEGFIPDHWVRKAPEPADARGTASTRIDMNTLVRERESERASVWSQSGDRSIPVIVTGDFNLPVESTIFRRHWGGLTDAFEYSGTGFGWTKREGNWLRVRIDHVLVTDQRLRPVGAWVGSDLGSDHLPVIADLQWEN